jgi:hypothetical protein
MGGRQPGPSRRASSAPSCCWHIAPRSCRRRQVVGAPCAAHTRQQSAAVRCVLLRQWIDRWGGGDAEDDRKRPQVCGRAVGRNCLFICLLAQNGKRLPVFRFAQFLVLDTIMTGRRAREHRRPPWLASVCSLPAPQQPRSADESELRASAPCACRCNLLFIPTRLTVTTTGPCCRFRVPYVAGPQAAQSSAGPSAAARLRAFSSRRD